MKNELLNENEQNKQKESPLKNGSNLAWMLEKVLQKRIATECRIEYKIKWEGFVINTIHARQDKMLEVYPWGSYSKIS